MLRKGEDEKLTYALYILAKAEGRFNNCEVFHAIGVDGLKGVDELHEAMSVLAHLIADGLDDSIKLSKEVESK